MDKLEWLKLRKQGIGSSDAAAVWGKSPYMSELELYEDKTSDEVVEETSYVMELGNQLEPEARKLFAAEYNILNQRDETFSPKLAVLPNLAFMMASLDGISESGTEIIEIKFQGKEAHLSNEIRENYRIQIQHQLLISGAKFCWFISYNPKCDPKLKYQKVERDEEFIDDHLELCMEFWSKVMNKIPPKPSDSDILVLKGCAKQAKRIAYLKTKISELEEEYETLKTELLEKVTHPKMRCGSLKINKIVKAGSIQYKNIPLIKNMEKDELEKYRGKASEYYQLTIEE